MSPVPDPNPLPAADARERIAESVIDALYRELHRKAPSPVLHPRSRLDADLGFDSLARAELVNRLEEALGIELSAAALDGAETLGDLLRVLSDAPKAVRPAGARLFGAPAVSVRALPRADGAAPDEARTLTEALSWRVDRHPGATHAIVLGDSGPRELSYAALLEGARAIAAGLGRYGLSRGAPVALMLPTSVDYLHVFFGVLLAGLLPVPLYPPAHGHQLEDHVRRHTEILANAGAEALITVREAHRLAHWLKSRVRALRHILTVADLGRGGEAGPAPMPLSGDSIALLQYTSGSTGSPKGVVLTHGQLLANIRAMGTAIGASDRDVFVSWLPLYHDMGLIGAWLGSLYHGCLLVLMPPDAFLARPARWLRAIGEYRGTLTAAPNFGYEFAAQRVSDEELTGLDLSSLRIAFNGAEPVYPETIERFLRRFAPCGLPPQALTPVYGLAEVGVGLTFPPLGRGPLVDRIDRELLSRSGRAQPVPVGASQAIAFVSSGRPLAGYRLRIVDERGAEVAERTEGALQFEGPSATGGYYRNADATARLLSGNWRNTGDRAYIAAGELYITGRAKDMVIRRGRHIYPEEIESAVGAIEGVRKGCVAVFGAMADAIGTERLIVVAETRVSDASQRDALTRRIMERITSTLGEPADEVLLLAPHSVLKTSSGKLRRAATRQAYLEGALGRAPRSPFVQMLRLFRGSVSLAAHRRLERAMGVMFGLCAWGVLLVFALPTVVLTGCVGSPLRRWRLNHRAAARVVRVLRFPLVATWQGQGDLRTPHVLVVNHASYVDSLLISALLRERHRFGAKAELARVPVLGGYLRRMGTVFIERFAPGESTAEVGRLTEALRGGDSLVLFPEGTFTGVTGLRAFHLGAFQAAAAARVPVIAVALRGTRDVMREGRWLPRRAPVHAVIGPPLCAGEREDVFAAAVRLRDEARAHILRHCGEPDLT